MTLRLFIGASVNAVSHDGKTAHYYARASNLSRVLADLEAAGALPSSSQLPAASVSCQKEVKFDLPSSLISINILLDPDG